jgi:putative Ca2+/H+ antiporter (TMEM165/GDT1 family)
VRLAVLAAVFPLIFLGELPDKTMFAALVMGARGRPGPGWLGTAAAFVVHVLIAVTVGAAVIGLLPSRARDAIVAAGFLAGAVLALRAAREPEEDSGARLAEARATGAARIALTAFAVVFVAEWGDLTQILTVNLAARYHAPLSVGLGALAALWAVAGLAVTAGRLLGRLPVAVLRRVTAGVLLVLAALSLAAASGVSWAP